MIKEICAKLRDKRRELGYRIEDVVEKTKLYPSVIKDIEAGDFSNINKAYLKGFIRIYASFLEVDLGDALEDSELSPAASLPKKEIKKEKKEIPPRVKKVIVFSLAGIFVLWGFGKIVRALGRKFHQKSVSSQVVPKLEREKAQSSAPGAEAGPEKAGSQSTVYAADEATLFLTTKRQCYLKVKVDGKIFFEGVLDKGIAETWKGKKEIELKVSDGSAVLLDINGESIPLLTSMRKPRSLRITPKGWEQI